MKQIYDFEQYEPPVLNKKILEEKLQEKRTARTAILAAVAGLIMQILILTAGILIYENYPVITALCFIYVVFSVISGSIISIIYSKKGVIIQ